MIWSYYVIDKHESYGTIQISRITSGGKRKFYGSPLQEHFSYISIRLFPSELSYSLGEERYFPSSGKPLCEINLTNAQFTEMITNLNNGSGVPCTIHSFDGKVYDPPPVTETEQDRIKSDFMEKRKDFNNYLESKCAELETLVNNSKLNKKEKTEFNNLVRTILRDCIADTPFLLEQFQESTERATQTFKIEVDSLLANMVNLLGTKTLQEMKSNNILPK